MKVEKPQSQSWNYLVNMMSMIEVWPWQKNQNPFVIVCSDRILFTFCKPILWIEQSRVISILNPQDMRDRSQFSRASLERYWKEIINIYVFCIRKNFKSMYAKQINHDVSFILYVVFASVWQTNILKAESILYKIIRFHELLFLSTQFLHKKR